MFLTNHISAFLLHDVRFVKNVACLSSLLSQNGSLEGVVSLGRRKRLLLRSQNDSFELTL